ncbi:YpiF family protein [Alkalihalobacillus sp. LMS39]|uniref:YpiF family protein n=1 Tax=Alkalihalobacillus sp. LMS39 TaxID=2924032 RepID=UPI001FB50CF9|nr:YpiF family protein [Alkalihalobacillus sp. LMS39]UOE92327.1 YpiF family protein [Alkalihalobacillus sp. LMS39]
MKWQTMDIDTYIQSKEYVDTAVVPLVPMSVKAEEMKSVVAMGEFISTISFELERQFRGRLIELPSFTYLKEETIEQKLEKLETWQTHLKENGLAHLIFLTSDSEWRTVEQQLSGLLIWLPTIPLEHLDSKYKMETVSDQIKQLIPIITKKWQS